MDLRDISPSCVSADELDKIQFLGELFSSEKERRRVATLQIPKLFSDLSTSELLQLIIFFGIARNDPVGIIARKRRWSLCNGNFAGWEPNDLAGGIEVLLGFPKSFEELLDLTISRAADRPGRGSLRKYLGVIVELTESRPFSENVVSKFRTLIPDSLNRRQNVALSPRVKTTGPKYGADTLSIGEACKKYRLSHHRFSALAALPGFLKSEGRGAGAPVLLDANKVDDAVQRYNELVSPTSAASELGITLDVLKRLVAAGFIACANGPETVMGYRGSRVDKPTTLFLRRTLQEFIESIELRATTLREPVRLINGTVKITDGVFVGLQGILQGKIAVGIGATRLRLLRRLLVEESEFRSFAYAKLKNPEELVSLNCAKTILNVKWAVAKELLEKMGTTLIRKQASFMVRRSDVCRIAAKYISGGEAAKLLGRFPRYLPTYLAPIGVRPAFVLRTRSAAFYDRQDFFCKAAHLFVQPKAAWRSSERKQTEKK